MGKVRGTLLMIALGYTGCATTGDRWPGCDFNRPGIVARIASYPLARLERTLCLGWCPVYAVEIDIDGQVAYKGRDFVMTHGSATGELSDEKLRSLREAVQRSRQAQMPREECACGCVTDASYVELTTWDKGVPRTVHYDEGCEQIPP